MKKIHSVLIVDDNEADLIIAELAIKGYDESIKIFNALDGRQALTMIAEMEKHPDLIFLDINMPGMDGHEFLEIYAKLDQHSSVVAMLTTSDQERDREQCLSYPFVSEYIVKPLESEDVRAIAERL